MSNPDAAIPGYLETLYWWAYVRPWAIRVFDRPWLVNAILFGNYARLRDAARDALAGDAGRLQGRTLQVACVYGDLTPRLLGQLGPDAQLDVIDVLEGQLANLRAKLPADPRVHLRVSDSSRIDWPDESFDQVLLFFLLHEQPREVRQATLVQAARLVRPGGRVVIVDYRRPAPWHPLRLPLRIVLGWLEPYAIELWRAPIADTLPAALQAMRCTRRRWFGSLYEMLVLRRPAAVGAMPALPAPQTGSD